MKRLSTFRADLLAILALMLLPLWLYWDVTFGGLTMLPADNLFQWAPWRAYASDFGVTTPQNSLLSDLILQNYPWRLFIREAIASRTIPLWSEHLFAGAPFLAKGQASVLYPFSLLFYIMPLPVAYGWFTVSQLWLAGVSAYLFGRILHQRRAAAAVAGLVYQGSGFILVSSAVFPMILGAAVWLPLLLGVIEMIVRINRSPRGAGKTLPWAALGALALGVQLLAGHPEITYYTLLIMALYALWRLLTHRTASSERRRLGFWLKPAAWLAGFVATGLLIGAIQFVPLYEVGRTNFRDASATYAEVIGWAFPARRVLTLALPNFFGNPAHHTVRDVFSGAQVALTTNAAGNLNPHGPYSTSWGIKNYVEGGIYLGILPLILASLPVLTVLGLALRRRWRELGRTAPANAAFFTLLSAFSLGCIFGTPVYALLFYGLPFIDQLHSPFRWVFALALCVALLAGYGLDGLLAAADRMPAAGETAARRQMAADHRVRLWLSRALFAGGAAGLLGLAFTRLAYTRLAPLIESVFFGLAQAADAFPSAALFYSYLFPQFLVLSVLLLLAAVIVRQGAAPVDEGPLAQKRANSAHPAHHRRLALLPFLIIAADLFLANRGFHAAVDPALLEFKPELVAWLEQQPDPWRFTTFEARGEKPFNANAGWPYGFEDIRGYDSIIHRQYTEYMAAIDTQNELPFNRIAPLHDPNAVNSPLLDLLNVKYILSADPLDAYAKLSRVWEGEGLIVYENLAVMPRAYTLPQTAAARVDDPLTAMRTIDPRGVLFLDGPARTASTPTPAAPQAATITAYGSLEVWVDVQVDEPSWLVLADSDADGWRAFARPFGADESAEEELTIERANGLFRAVPLDDPGAYTVRFRYSPRPFIVGALASFMGGILVVFAFGVWAWRRFYRQEGELTNTQSIAKNSVVPMALNLFNKGIDFAFAMFYLRVLGPAGSGAYATAITIALWFDIVANWGLDALIIREGAQEREKAGHYLFNTSILRLATMIVGIIPVLLFVGEGIVSGNPLTPEILLALGLIATGMVFSGLSKGLTGIFYVFEEAEYPAALTTVSTIIKVALGVAVLLAGWGFVGLAGLSIVTNVITLVLLSYTAWRRFPLRGPWRLDWALQRRAFIVGWPLMLNHLLATVFFKIDQALLYRLMPPDTAAEQVGWYNSAYKWVDAFNIIPSFFTFALFPVISRQVKSNLDDARRTFRISVKLLVVVALPLAAVVTLLADFMIGTLGGAAFLPEGALALRLVIWSIPIGWINSVTNYTIVSLGLERRLTWAFVVGVLFNTLGNIWLIPRFGFVAAAGTTIASEIVLLVMFNYFLQQRMPGVGWLSLLWKLFAATGLMVLVAGAAAQASVWLGVLVGPPVYLLALWRLRTLTEDERAIGRSLLPAPLARWLADRGYGLRDR